MAVRYAFLETIAGRSALGPEQPVPANLAESVRENLIILLNTRQGSVVTQPEYGIPDISKFYEGFPDSLGALGRALALAVARFEPRIRDLKVELTHSDPDQFQATFSLMGWLDDPQVGKVEFHTVISGDGHAKVNS